MESHEVRALCARLDMTQKEIAEQIEVSHGHLRNVMTGERNLSRASGRLLRDLVRRRGRKTD